MKDSLREGPSLPDSKTRLTGQAVPIRVFGIDSQGRDFSEPTETLTVDRLGASFRLRKPLIVGDVVCIRNLRSHREAQFRVVACLGSMGDSPNTRAWAVEPLDAPPSFWGITLPSQSVADQTIPPQPMQCCACGQADLVESSAWHQQVLESSGRILRFCSRCHQETLWKPATTKIRPASADAQARATDEPRGERRQRKRASMRVKVRVRLPYSSYPEVTFSENLSADGLAFISARDYPVGTELRIIAPFLQDDFHAEVPAKVVRQSSLTGTPHKLYGVRFLKPSRRS